MEIQTLKISKHERKLVSDFIGEDIGNEIDFNRLMPVVEKISDTLKRPETPYNYWMVIKFDKPITTSKKDIYDAVIQFIQWYNKNNSPETAYLGTGELKDRNSGV